MSSSRRSGRRIPSKSHGLRAPAQLGGPRPTGDPAAFGPLEGPQPNTGAPTSATPPPSPGAYARAGSRSSNRAAKRAVTGVRPKTNRGGGRQTRGSNTGLIVLGLAAVAIVAAVIVIGNPFGSPAPSAAPVVYGNGTCPTSQPASLAAGDVKTVTIETNLGDIVIELDGSLSPIATGNFAALVACHYYDGVVFHRLVPGFAIQGGDPDGTGAGPGPGYSITDDPLTTTYKRGTVAMARTPDANSQGSQFFIVLSDDANAPLTDPQNAPYPYAILGEVVSGMDVVDAIAAMPNAGGQTNAAIDPVVMNSVTLEDGAPVVPTPSPAPTATAIPTQVPSEAPASTPPASPAASSTLAP